MENERNLESANLQPAISSIAATAVMAQAARTGPKWQRYLMMVFIAMTLLATGAGLIGKIGRAHV